MEVEPRGSGTRLTPVDSPPFGAFGTCGESSWTTRTRGCRDIKYFGHREDDRRRVSPSCRTISVSRRWWTGFPYSGWAG